ncbi:hypothetical protein [Caballeronia sp. DA-9]|uniref:hypothetical protein n=1 Tax=Caballeronia sp. DA-9 TaxID=3436237 RepID=UPI003F66CD6F
MDRNTIVTANFKKLHAEFFVVLDASECLTYLCLSEGMQFEVYLGGILCLHSGLGCGSIIKAAGRQKQATKDSEEKSGIASKDTVRRLPGSITVLAPDSVKACACALIAHASDSGMPLFLIMAFNGADLHRAAVGGAPA